MLDIYQHDGVFGACFDEQDKLLYLFKRFWVDNKFPCVHVYRVK